MGMAARSRFARVVQMLPLALRLCDSKAAGNWERGVTTQTLTDSNDGFSYPREREMRRLELSYTTTLKDLRRARTANQGQQFLVCATPHGGIGHDLASQSQLPLAITPSCPIVSPVPGRRTIWGIWAGVVTCSILGAGCSRRAMRRG